MGYYIDMKECNLVIERRHFRELVRVINRIKEKDPITCNDKEIKDYFETEQLYSVDITKAGLSVEGQVDSMKLGDWVTEFLDAIAPLVKSGGFLEFRGEDDELWRWLFVSGQRVEITSTIVWETEDTYRIEEAR